MPPSLAVARDALLRTGVCGILTQKKVDKRKEKMRETEVKEKKIENREKQCQCIRKGKLTRTNGKVGSNMTVFRGVSMQRDPDVTSESVEQLRRHKERRCFWET